MTQNIVNYSNNPDGPELLDDYLIKQQQNELTTNSGIQRPSYAVAGTKWLDTSSTPWLWKMFDGTSDIILGSINPTTHSFSAAGLDTAVLLTGDQTVGGIKTFSNNPLVPNVASGDNSSKVANTAFVTGVASGLQTQINTKANSSDVTSAINNLLTSLYPIGSLYITTQNTEYCPIASLIPGSQWELVGKDHALWTTDGTNANTTIPAGLPTISGSFYSERNWQGIFRAGQDGAFTGLPQYGWGVGNEGAGQSTNAAQVWFNASDSNSIYGASNTVQPQAYRVNAWRRIA